MCTTSALGSNIIASGNHDLGRGLALSNKGRNYPRRGDRGFESTSLCSGDPIPERSRRRTEGVQLSSGQSPGRSVVWLLYDGLRRGRRNRTSRALPAPLVLSPSVLSGGVRSRSLAGCHRSSRSVLTNPINNAMKGPTTAAAILSHLLGVSAGHPILLRAANPPELRHFPSRLDGSPI